MREILFRGKTINSNEWVESMTISNGTIKRKRNDLFMEISENKWVGVIPETVGQFVGLTDKSGKPAFVGNIYKEVRFDGSERYYRIFEVPGGFAINTHQDDFYRPDEMVYFWSGLSDMQTASFFQNSLVEIGNVFDNPELLIKKHN